MRRTVAGIEVSGKDLSHFNAAAVFSELISQAIDRRFFSSLVAANPFTFRRMFLVDDCSVDAALGRRDSSSPNNLC